MKKRKISIFLSFLIIFTGVMFFNVEKVDAAGYAKCWYTGKKALNLEDGSGTLRYHHYKIAIYVEKSNNKYVGSGEISCVEQSGASPIDVEYITGGKCKINNINSALKNNSSVLKNNFYKNGKWSCPSQIYVERDGWKSLALKFSNPNTDKTIKMPLLDNESKQTGKGSVSEKDVTGSVNNEGEETGENSGVEGNPEGINKWADEYVKNTDIDDVSYYENCNIIGEDTRKIISDILLIVSIVGVLIFIALTMFELLKALVSSDDNKISKIMKSLIVRIACVVLLLLLPVIVTSIIDLVNYASNNGLIKSGNPLCGVEKQ